MGLMYPSRKQDFVQEQRIVSPTIVIEKKNSSSYARTDNVGGTYTIYTCPVNKKATLISASIVNGSAGVGPIIVAVRAAGSDCYYHAGVLSLQTDSSFFWGYESGPEIISGQTFEYNLNGSVRTYIAIVVFEEDYNLFN